MIERVPWATFVERFRWSQGEHVSMIGTTGGGKTTLALAIMPRRRYAIVFGTKPKDPTLDGLMLAGWQRITRWEDRPPLKPTSTGRGVEPVRLVLWPEFRKMADTRRHQTEFRAALEDTFTEGNWSVFVDEVGYVAKDLGLDALVKQWLKQGRSIGLTLVSATQRPAWIPVECYSEASHLFLWRSNDNRDLKRLSDIAGPVDRRELTAAVQSLDFRAHEVLYVSARTGEMMITIPPPPTKRR